MTAAFPADRSWRSIWLGLGVAVLLALAGCETAPIAGSPTLNGPVSPSAPAVADVPPAPQPAARPTPAPAPVTPAGPYRRLPDMPAADAGVVVPPTAEVPKLLMARTLLFGGVSDRGPFGAFSYLLLKRAPPNTPGHIRMVEALTAYAAVAAHCGAVASDIPAASINIFYAPVRLPRETRTESAGCGTPDELKTMLLANYDFERATVFLFLAGIEGPGPYLVSSPRPLVDLRPEERNRLLVFDLSAVPPARNNLVGLWVSEFIARASRPGEWNDASIRDWGRQILTWIVANAEGWQLAGEAAAATVRTPR